MREDNVRKIWSEAELDAALADLHGDDVEEDDGLAFARSSLLAAAGAGEAPPAGPRRAGAWRWLAVAAAVVTLVGGLGVAATLWTPNAPEPARPAAALPDLDRPLAPGEYRYAQKLTWLPQIVFGRPVQLQQKTELWIPADPTGVWHRRSMWTGAVRGLTPELEQSLKVNLSPLDEDGDGGVFAGAPGHVGETGPGWNTPLANWLTPDAAFVASLVPDRAVLADRLRLDTISTHDKGKGQLHSPTESLGMARSVLELGLVRKDVRLALRDALTDVPGIAVVPGVPGPGGRPATVLQADDTGRRLFLDPATAQLLAADTNPGTPITRSADVPIISTSQPPPISVPITTMNTRPPPAPQSVLAPEMVYSFAISRDRW
ncbi:hypothetical protein [Amycolatopsis sp. CA-128772]|uniref:hypothetical protein n=1 Tax=Amycolatopsis sp. CA-128772 TaxID=2073159 RepID=UPI000CD0A1AB|nr:hypothetical protein [Amycolatopsis sp. CA-128772]